MKNKIMLLLIVSILLTGLFISCGDDTKSDTANNEENNKPANTETTKTNTEKEKITEEKVLVAGLGNWMPWQQMIDNKRAEGILVEIFQKACEQIGYKAEFKDSPNKRRNTVEWGENSRCRTWCYTGLAWRF